MAPRYIPSALGLLLLQLCFWGWALFELWVNVRVGRAGTANHDRWSRFVIIGGMILGFWLANAITYLLPAFDLRWHRRALYYAGLVIMGSGLGLRWLAIHQLGQFFIPEVVIQPGQQLLETGLYAHVRHPSYTGILVTTFGYGLTHTNVLALVVLLALCGGVLAYRIRVEEAALLAAFGEPYRAYMGRTRRLIPWLF